MTTCLMILLFIFKMNNFIALPSIAVLNRLVIILLLAFTELTNASIVQFAKEPSTDNQIGIDSNSNYQEQQLIFNEPANHKIWRSQLLAGVDRLNMYDAVPGQAMVFDQNAAVIIVGDKAEDIFMIATEIGKGRVVVMTHDYGVVNFTSNHYDINVRQLHRNIKNWITKGKYISDRKNLMQASEFVRRGRLNTTLAIYTAQSHKPSQVNQNDRNQVLNFVKEGGGLFLATCTWGWYSYWKNFSLMLSYNTYKEAGIVLMNEYIANIEHFDCKKTNIYLSNLGLQFNYALLNKDYILANRIINNANISQKYQLQFKERFKNSISEKKLQNQYFQPSNHVTWRSQILNQVDQIPILSKLIPGKLIVYNPKTAVIMRGDSYNDIFIAAAQVGNGRVIVMTHDFYLHNFTDNHPDKNVKQLHQNIKNWITKGKYNFDDQNIIQAAAFFSSSKSNILALYTQDSYTISSVKSSHRNKILNFVKNGGGIVISVCSWGWAQQMKTKDFSLMLTSKVLLQAGIAFLPQQLIIDHSFYPVNANLYLSNLAIQLNIVLSAQYSKVNYDFLIEEFKKLPNGPRQQLINIVSNYFSQNRFVKMAPSLSNPTTSFHLKRIMQIYYFLFLESSLPGVVAPGYEIFPGSVIDYLNYLQSKSFNFQGLPYQQFHQTGYYAIAGQTVVLEFQTSSNISQSWQVLIGFHLDNNSLEKVWVRWPIIYTKKSISVTSNLTRIQMNSPFGGLVIFKSPPSSKVLLKVRIKNVLKAPFYNSQDQTSKSEWKTRKSSLGAWGCLKGKYVCFCMPRASLQVIDNPLNILDIYDQIYKSYHILRGSSPDNQRIQYLISDVKVSIKQMHSGYPIVIPLNFSNTNDQKFIFNYENMKTKGQWEIFGQIGHNMKRSWWTYNGTAEVTNNIFSLRATQIVLGLTPKNCPWLSNYKQKALNYLKRPYFFAWKRDAGIALMIYAQIIEDFGWDTIKRVISSYQIQNAALPVKNQDKIDIFWSKVQKQSGYNLQPLLKKWGINVTNHNQMGNQSLVQYKQKVNLFA